MGAAKLFGGAVVIAVATAALSFVHPWGNLRSGSSKAAAVLAGTSAPDEIRNVLGRKCGDCHSNNTRWPLYGKIAPTSWFIEHDVREGRDHLNLSLWDQYSAENRIDLLSKMGSQIRQGKMPLRRYLLLHPEARLSDLERKLIQDWSKVERKRLLSQEMK
jgi:cytochrome c